MAYLQNPLLMTCVCNVSKKGAVTYSGKKFALFFVPVLNTSCSSIIKIPILFSGDTFIQFVIFKPLSILSKKQ